MSDSRQASGMRGRKSPKTFSCTSSVVASFMAPWYEPFQRNVLPPLTTCRPAVSMLRPSRTWRKWGGKSSPTTPTSRTGAKNEAATEK